MWCARVVNVTTAMLRRARRHTAATPPLHSARLLLPTVSPMTHISMMNLPRPEDRCRGDLERWVGCRGAQPNWRSEGFAEDMVLPPAAAGEFPSPTEAVRSSLRRFTRPLLWADRLGLVRG